MASAIINGITTHYEVSGSGPPLLMMAPGGFDSTIQQWSRGGVWETIRPLETFAQHYMCIAYDRREAGESGGRVERISWASYAEQAKGLLEHLGIHQAYVMGGCMGCSAAIAFSVAHPEATLGLMLHWPVGGARYRTERLGRLDTHRAYVQERGLDKVVSLARAKKSFGQEPKAGPWASVIATDEAFALAFAAQDVERYLALVAILGRSLYDRDTSPGAEPEELMTLKVPALIIPGRDPAHATSAARYLEECLPQAEYWDVAVEEQTVDWVQDRILGFLSTHASALNR